MSLAGLERQRQMFRQDDRECDLKGGSGWPTTLCSFDLAAVVFDDLFADRQAQAGAVGFGGEEWIEEPFGDLVRDAAAGIR